MIQILSGPDDFSLREWLAELKKTLGDETLLSLNTTRLEGQALTPAELKTSCETAPFMADRRLIIATGLLGRFEPKRKPGRPGRAERAAGSEDQYRAFGAAMKQVPDSTVLLLVDENVSSGNPLFKLISAQAKMKQFPLLKGDKLTLWVRRRVKTEGGTLSDAAAGILVRLIGSNLWVMANEIRKLVLLTSGRQIEEADVRAAVSYAQESTVFPLVDAILEFRAGAAGQMLEQMRRDGVAPGYLLTMIARQARLIILARELRNEGLPPAEMQNRLGVTDFVLRKTMELAGRYSLPRVSDVYRKLLDTDVSIKTGRCDGDLALNILVADLCQKG